MSSLNTLAIPPPPPTLTPTYFAAQSPLPFAHPSGHSLEAIPRLSMVRDQTGARAMTGGDFGGLCTMRALRQDVITSGQSKSQ